MIQCRAVSQIHSVNIIDLGVNRLATPSIKLSPRKITGNKVSSLRKRGIIPVHVYGWDIAPQALEVEAQKLHRILPQIGTNISISLEIEGQKGENICFVREIQRHPVTEELLHVDFLRVNVASVIRSEVPIILLGEAPAVRDLGGTLLQQLQALTVDSLPMDVPSAMELDISYLDDFEKTLTVADLSITSKIDVVTRAEEMIAKVSAPRVAEAEEAPEEDGDLVAEGAEDTGEEANEAADSTPSG